MPEDWEEGLTFTARSSRKYNTNEFVHFGNVRSSVSYLQQKQLQFNVHTSGMRQDIDEDRAKIHVITNSSSLKGV